MLSLHSIAPGIEMTNDNMAAIAMIAVVFVSKLRQLLRKPTSVEEAAKHRRLSSPPEPTALVTTGVLFGMVLMTLPVWDALTAVPRADIPALRIQELAARAAQHLGCQHGPGKYQLVLPVVGPSGTGGRGVWTASGAAEVCRRVDEAWEPLPRIGSCPPRVVECTTAVVGTGSAPPELFFPASHLGSGEPAAAAAAAAAI
eukprot:SAG22_NODE_9269_length_599_cov_1.340000_1_plen_199_part_11